MNTHFVAFGKLSFEQHLSIYAARGKFRNILLCGQMDSAHLDFILVGFAELCRHMQASRGVLEIGLQGDRLQLRCADCKFNAELLSAFFYVAKLQENAVIFELYLPTLADVSFTELSDIINFKSREELFRDLENNQVNMEHELVRLVSDYAKKRSAIFGRSTET
jgi:hypothetical protein